MSTELEDVVARGRMRIRNTLRQLDTRSQQGELSLAEIRHLRRLIRLGQQLDALEDGIELPYSPADEQARDFLEDTVDRIEALGDKATAKDFGTLREATRLLHEIERRDARRASRRPPSHANGAVERSEPSELARRLLNENGNDKP